MITLKTAFILLNILFVQLSNGTSVSEQKCKDYASSFQTCFQQMSSKDNIKAEPKEFPHMALIEYDVEDIKGCAGILISEQFVLTAAVCLTYKIPKSVKLGVFDLSNELDDTNAITVNISRFIVHPQYGSTKHYYHDIGLIELANPISFNEYIRPACLQQDHDLNVTNVVGTGWGKTDHSDDVTFQYLKKVPLRLFNHPECNQTYSSRLKNGILDNIQLCAGPQIENAADVCQGMTGGPIQIYHQSVKCMYSVVGIISFGIGCNTPGIPGVNTRISAYLPWIEKIVWPIFDEPVWN